MTSLPARATFLRIFNADGLLALKQYARGQRLHLDGEIRTVQRRNEIALRRAATLAILDGKLIGANAFLLRAIEIIRIGMTGLLACLDKSIEQHVRLAGIADAERAIAAMKRAVAILIAFRTAEIGQHIRKAPAFKAELTPHVIVARMAANIDHAVDRGRPAKHLATRPVELAIVQVGLAFRLIAPVRHIGADQLSDACRHVDHEVRILLACFKKQNLVRRIFRKAVRKHAACAACADDDVIEFAHTLSPVPVSGHMKQGCVRPACLHGRAWRAASLLGRVPA
jgi:hypothetical protein